MKNKENLIIFDCDGVLVDSEKLIKDYVLDQLSTQGINSSFEVVSKYFDGSPLDVIFKSIESSYSADLPSIFEDEFREELDKRFQNHLVPIKGIIDALEDIKITKCVASSSTLDRIKLSLEKTGLTKFFDNKIFSSYLINSWKPEPDIFIHAANEMGYKPNNCIVIEDSPMGVRAGKRAKMKVLGYSYNSNEKELEDEGAIIFNDMSILPSLIKDLLK